MPKVSGGVRLERRGNHVAMLQFHRPEKLNALSDRTVAETGRLLRTVASDPLLRVLIMTGAGSGFCSGFDLSLADKAPGDSKQGETIAWTERQEAFASLVTQLRALRQPVIAAINGAASGAGLALALASDIRIAAKSARFNAAFVKVGLSGCDMGVSWLLPRCVGTSRAFEMMLTGRTVGGAEAGRIGLVSETVDDSRLIPRAMELARLIAAHSAFGVWMTKRGAWANLEAASLQAAIELENRTQMLARTTGELSRAAKAMLARRG